jgi:hypothetical protein
MTRIENGLRAGLDEWQYKMGIEMRGLCVNFSRGREEVEGLGYSRAARILVESSDLS